MTSVKAVASAATVLLALGAGFGAGSAGAADRGVAAPGVDYVKVCDAYGNGFFFLPGTETCLKFGGYVRAEYRVGDSNWGRRSLAAGTLGGYAGAQGWDARNRNGAWTRGRSSISWDARTATEYGTLRSFIDIWTTLDTGATGPTILIDNAYFQFAGLTVGRAESFFDFFTSYSYNKTLDYYSYTKVNLLAYSAKLGDGLTATLSIEDPTTGARSTDGAASDAGFYFGSKPGTGLYAGMKRPDIVGSLVAKGAWGSAQLAAASHNVSGPGAGAEGFAVMAGAKLALPFLGERDEMVVQSAFSRGGVDFVAANNYQILSGTSSLANLGGDFVADGAGQRAMHLTTAWNVVAGLRHNFSARWQANIGGAVTTVDGYGNRDYRQYDLGGNIVWTAAAGFQISGGFEYRTVDFSKATIADHSSATVTLRNPHILVGVLRFQRNL